MVRSWCVRVFFLVFVFLSLESRGGVRDSLGVEFPERSYKRIVSLAPSITEILKFLGLEKSIIGVTRYCDFDARRVGGVYDPDIEGILNLNPDIVFILKVGNRESYEALAKMGLSVFVLEFRRLEDILYWIRKISILTRTYEVNRKKILEVEHTINRLIGKARRVVNGKRFVVVYSYPLIYTASSNDYVADIIRKVGGINLPDHFPSQYQTVVINVESLLYLSPDVVVVAERNFDPITNELKALGLNSRFIRIDPMDVSPSLRITNFVRTLVDCLRN